MGDVLAIIEAAYAPCANERSWLANLVAVARPVFGEAPAVAAHSYAFDDDGRVKIGPLVCEGASSEVVRAAGVAMLARLPVGHLVAERAYPRSAAAATFRQLVGDATDAVYRTFPPLFDDGARPKDALGILGGDLAGHGVVLNAYALGRYRLTAPKALLFARVAAHLAAGYRLHRHASPLGAPDAVLRPTGRIEHAEPDAQPRETRAALGHAAAAIDRARGRLRRADPEKAAALWTALVRGRWSLVEQIDTDGRRYLFARRNAPDVVPWDALTPRERQVVAYAAEGQSHKMVAYQLGIALSTVASQLRSAARKLGLASRHDLVRAYKSRTAPP